MSARTTVPSGALDAAHWDEAHDDLVATLRELIRIPSVNPPAPAAPDGELLAARHIAERLRGWGLQPEVIEPVMSVPLTVMPGTAPG